MGRVFNHSIHEFIGVKSLLKTSDDAEINWEINTCDTIEDLEEKEKAESEEEREDVTNQYSTDAPISNFPTVLNHVTHLKQFLMNKKVTVLEDFKKVESKLEKEFIKQQQQRTKTSITYFLDCFI